MSNIEEKIEQELAEARAVCDVKGGNSAECAAAWDAIEELQAEIAHQRAEKVVKTAFEEYCDEYPQAKTIYDNSYSTWPDAR